MKEAVDAFCLYLIAEKGLAKLTVAAYKQDILSFFFFLQNKPLNEVEESDVITYLGVRKAEKASPASLHRYLMSLKVFFKFLVKEGLLTLDCAKRLDAPKLWQTLPTVLSVEEMTRLLHAPDLSTLQGVRDRAILEVLYGTGIRVQELCDLCIEHVGETTLRVMGKGRKERLVPLGQYASCAIDRYLLLRETALEKGVLFVSKKGGKLSRNQVFRLVVTYAKQVHLQKNVSPHTFRHSFATHLLDRGADVRVIQEFLGHAAIGTTDRYTHVSLQHLKEKFDKFHPKN